MSGTEMILEYTDRLRRSGIYRGFAVLLIILSIIGLSAFISFRENFEFWGELFLPAGIILLVLALSLALLSYITLRCPNCYRILGGIRAAVYCPSCGTRLMEAESRELESIPGDELTEGAEDFPEETYPKDIRMFTTPDETELAKRFIRLMDKDDAVATDEQENPGDESDSAGEMKNPEVEPNSGGGDTESDETDLETGGSQKPQWRIEHEKNQTNPEDIIFSFLGAIFRFGRH